MISPSDPVGVGRDSPSRVTPGPWRSSDVMDLGEPASIHSCWFHGSDDEVVADIIRRDEDEANRDLIVAAVNACFALNPQDPLAAAQHLEALVKAATEFLPLFQVLIPRLRYQKPGDEFWPNREEGESSLDALQSALSRVTGS